MNPKQVLEILVDQGIVEKAQVEDILQEVSQAGKSLLDVLVDFQITNEEQFYQTIASYLGLEYVDLTGFEPPPEIVRLIPAGLALLHRVFPIGIDAGTLQVVIADPLTQETPETLRFALGKEIQPIVAPVHQIDDLIKKSYGTDIGSMDEILKQLGGEVELIEGGGGIDLKSLEAEANATPIIRYVDLILYQAIQDRASDIHFEPFETEFKIRYRVDGALYEMSPPPRHLALPVISRVKVMSNLNIAERRLPQDGRIQKNIAGRQVDLRVSTLPTQFGESVVLRVLDRTTVNLNIEALGMPDYI